MFDGTCAGARDGRDVPGFGVGADTDEWRKADIQLRALAARRAALDVEEARWLVVARRTSLHRHLGFVTLAEYMERALGYGPHAAAERLRVAEALEVLPATRESLATGRLSFSAVRELTRVAIPETESTWIAAALGKTMREIEPMVAGRRPGDLPGDAPDPERLRHVVRFDVSGPTLALLRDARIALAEETGERLDDDHLVAALCKAVLAGRAVSGDPGRATHQVAISICETCDRGWQHGGGAAIEIPPAAVERARCDAQHIGRVDAAVPARATQDMPPAVRRLIWRRDHGRCVVPGCRSARHLEIHHLVRRADGGAHTPDNCVLLCDGHHAASHEGRLLISGMVSTGVSFAHDDGRAYGAPPPDPSPLPRIPTAMQDDAIAALHQVGFTVAQSRSAVTEAAVQVGADAPLEVLIRRALAACRRAT